MKPFILLAVMQLLALATGQNEVAERLEASWLAQALIVFGAVFIVAAGLGMLRFPDFYTRLHASTKLVTLGGLGVLVGAAIAFREGPGAERAVLIALFFLLTAPLSGYMIARAGYLAGVKPTVEDTSVDEWGALGDGARSGSGQGLDA